jgi:hypothetical protein
MRALAAVILLLLPGCGEGQCELSASISTTADEVQILVGTIWRGNVAPFAVPQPLRIRPTVG